MMPKLPLHSPRWRDLHGVEAGEVDVLLGQLSRAGAAGSGDGSGDGWRGTWARVAGALLDDGTVANGAYAALPHLVEAAAALPPGRTADFWVDVGCVVTAENRPPVPADLAAGYGAALRLAERAAVRSLLAADAPARDRALLGLACVAFAGHPVGEALWRFPGPGQDDLLLTCPGCGSDTELPGFFAAPARPPAEVPARARRGGRGAHPWGEVAAALREPELGKGWEPFLRVARDVAAAGVPAGTPGPAVLCLVAGMVAAGGAPRPDAGASARQLMALTGDFGCWDCERTWPIADGLADGPHGARPRARPAEAPRDSAVTPDAPARRGGAATRFRQDGGAVLAGDGTPWGRVAVFSGSAPGASGGVDVLAVVPRPGRPPLVAGAGDSGALRLWDAADGRLVHAPPPGRRARIRSLTTVRLSDGRVLLASGGDAGTFALWDPGTGRPVREADGERPGGVTGSPTANVPDGVIGMCAAIVPGGRTVLVTATPRGTVRVWDPDSGERVGRLNPYGSPIRSIAAVPVSPGHTLVAASDTAGRLHVWDPAVDDPWERGAAVPLSARAIADAGHRAAAVAAVPAPGRSLLATGDDQGVVLLWDLATGAPAGGGLPAGPGTAGVPVLTAATPPGGRTVLVAGTRHGHRLRLWEPETGAVRHIALEVALTCLAVAGPDLVVGHDRGVLSLPLTGR